jgi:hypothetical protein
VIGWDKTAHQYPDQLRWGTLNGAPSDPPRSQT